MTTRALAFTIGKLIENDDTCSQWSQPSLIFVAKLEKLHKNISFLCDDRKSKVATKLFDFINLDEED